MLQSLKVDVKWNVKVVGRIEISTLVRAALSLGRPQNASRNFVTNFGWITAR